MSDPAPLSRMLTSRVYPAVGRCIYCGRPSTEVALTSEHILAKSLGGTLILPGASCADCQSVTGAFEGHNAGRLFRPIRRQFGFPSWMKGKKRREREAKETFRVVINGKRRDIPAAEYPGLLMSFKFEFPTILMGLPPAMKEFAGGVSIATLPEFGERLNALRAKYGQNVSFPARGSSEEVGRLLAKTAHAFAVAEIGLAGFKPYLLGIIRGHDPLFMGHVVGSSLASDPVGTDLHEISILPPDALDSGNLVVVCIRLFANYKDIATHYVVAGERILPQ